MIAGLTRLAVRRSGRVLLAALLAVPLLAVLGGNVEQRLSVGGFLDPAAPSTRIAEQLEAVFDAAAPNEVLVAVPTAGSVTDAANVRAGLALVERLRTQPGVVEVLSPWTLGSLPEGVRNPLRSDVGDAAVIAVRLAGDEDDQRRAAEGLARFRDGEGRFRLTATGPAEVSRAAAETADRDLLRAELIAAPLTFIGLLLVFRGWRAAAIPLVVAVLAVLATFTALAAATAFTTISVFSLNLTTALGLGLAVDYSLLVVARFRAERRDGRDVAAAVQHTMATAGRTVVLSAATVMLSMLALLVFPVAYLRSFAMAGVTVVGAAALATLSVVPAILTRYGHRLGVERRPTGDGGFWARQARRVMGRPWHWAVGVSLLLVLLGLPFSRFDAGRIDDRALPSSADARRGAEQVRAGFEEAEFHPITVLAPHIDPSGEQTVRAMVERLMATGGVERVDSVLGFTHAGGTIAPTAYNERFRAAPADGTWFNVISAHPPEAHASEATVRAIRDLDPRLQVGGTTAAVLDTVDVVRARLPLALATIALTTLVLLFLMTGSVLIPFKALALNLLSLSASFGLLVWIFQDGHLAGALGVTPTGRIDVFTPILVFCIAFGLSMDYEVFLLARIKEHADRGGDNHAAVVHGLGHTGAMVTAAAGLLAVVFVAIATSGVVTVKMFGVGLAVAVLVDAFLVRATLVPALMQLAGDANWWAPRPLRRLHARWALREDGPTRTAPPEPAPTVAAREAAVR